MKFIQLHGKVRNTNDYLMLKLTYYVPLSHMLDTLKQWKK